MPDMPMTRISIFLSIFDAHVQRAPVAGEVVTIKYRPGKFVSAERDEASEVNECNSMLVPHRRGRRRRRRPDRRARRAPHRVLAHVGDKVDLGETYGLIRFGSRLDTYLPRGRPRSSSRSASARSADETVLAELA